MYRHYLVFILLFVHHLAFANSTEQNGQIWAGINDQGHISGTQLNHLLVAQVRFTNHASKAFKKGILRGGLGYPLHEHISAWLGYDFVPIYHDNSDEYDIEQRIWQQLSWNFLKRERLSLDSRSRLEQRWSNNNSGTSVRFRQKFTAYFHLQYRRFTPIIFDELFINVNNPGWNAVDDIEKKDQNRLFVGVEFPTGKDQSLQVGYLNQYKYGNPTIINHVIYVTYHL